MTEQEHIAPRRSNSYELFILVLTVLSLVIMALQFLGTIGWLPINDETVQLLRVYDNLICIVFLADFVMNVAQTRPRRDYFIGRRGWLDLIGSVPSFGVTEFGGLLRLARLSRLARVARLLRGQRKKELTEDIIRNRGQYAAFITMLAAGIVLVSASLLVLQFEAGKPGANIETGGDALWWAIVTITTVGYGDQFPVTFLGRVTGVAVMFAGVGIIGALASILASILVPSPQEQADAVAAVAASNAATAAAAGPPAGTGSPSDTAGVDAAALTGVLRDELGAIRAEVAKSREELAANREELVALRRALPVAAGDPPSG